MNILMMTNTYLPHVGGVARSVASSATWLREHGHRVLVAAPAFEGATDSVPGVFRVPALQHFNGSDFSVPLPITGPLHRAISSFEPELVHSHHPFLLGDTALRVGAEFDLPVVFTHHTLYEHYTRYVPLDSSRMRRLAIEFATSYANLCDVVFAPSETVAALIRERGVRSRIEIVSTGVDVDRFSAGDGAAFRRSQDIPADATLVGHVGRLAAEKNLGFLGRALSAFALRDPVVQVLIVGGGSEASKLRAHFAEQGLALRLHLAGVLQGEELTAAYRAMDLFAFSSKTETQGLVLAEALAAGVPVVAIDAPGVREVVRDGVNGRLLFSEKLDDFVSALTWVARPDIQGRLEAGVAETALAYSIDATGPQALAIYAELKGNARRADANHRAWAELRRRIHEEWRLVSHRTHVLHHSWAPPKALR